MLVPEDSYIVSARDKTGQEIVYPSSMRPLRPPGMKLALLVNKGSASASEILSGTVNLKSVRCDIKRRDFTWVNVLVIVQAFILENKNLVQMLETPYEFSYGQSTSAVHSVEFFLTTLLCLLVLNDIMLAVRGQAGAVQDLDAGIVVGPSTTYGKGRWGLEFSFITAFNSTLWLTCHMYPRW